MQSVNCLGHNVRGLKDEKLEELVEHMRQRRIWAYALQETWRVGDFQMESDGFLFINHGYPERRCSRGSGGVGFVLSPEARKAWEAAGSKVMHFGERIVAIKLRITDMNGQRLDVMMVSAYAPVGASPVEGRGGGGGGRAGGGGGGHDGDDGGGWVDGVCRERGDVGGGEGRMQAQVARLHL